MMHAHGQGEDWQTCPEGTLDGLARRLRARRQTYSLTRLGAVMSLVTLSVAVGVVMIGLQLEDRNQGGITCHDVVPLLREYRLGQLPDEVATQVAEHLAVCDTCQQALQQLAGGKRSGDTLAGAAHTPRRLLAQVE